MPTPHTPPAGLDYAATLTAEHTKLEEVDIPIITVSATFRQHIEDLYHDILPKQEVTFSRAHYSMATAVLVAALEAGHSSWITDPTNFVSKDEWGKILFTHEVARFIARHNALKPLKDAIDTRARNKLPISNAIDDPLIYLTQHVTRPLLSLHYEAGNIAHAAGHKVIQVVTDPHVRPQYLFPLSEKPTQNIFFCVFDEDTKTEFLLKADLLKKKVDPGQVIVTGPPVDPRLISFRKKKLADVPRSFGEVGRATLNLAITTGGIGSNKDEIKAVLTQLLPMLKKGNIKLLLNASTHQDFLTLYQEMCAKAHLTPAPIENMSAPVRIIHANNIVDVNELLNNYMFPWAHGIITKPSGDMAYDAAASGSFCLFLSPLGDWEVNIRDRFELFRLGTTINPHQFTTELTRLNKPFYEGNSWFSAAHQGLIKIPKIMLEGSHNIIKAYLDFAALHHADNS